jgi:hypothetical protein
MKITEVDLGEIESKIYLIRGEKVMLDDDLAALYMVSTTRLNEQVKRNLRRFPDDFMFRLSDQEFRNLISQIAISSHGHGGRRKPPLAFTEQGVAMLSAVKRSRVLNPGTTGNSRLSLRRSKSLCLTMRFLKKGSLVLAKKVPQGSL